MQVASDGLELVGHLRRKEHDLAIVDASLPLMDGFQAAALARSTSPRMPFVITSTYDDPQLRQQAAHLGVYAFIVKPVDASRLAWLVEQAAGAVGERGAGTRPRARAAVRSPSHTLQRLQPGHALIVELSAGKAASVAPGRASWLGPFASRLVAFGPKWFAAEARSMDAVQEPAALGTRVSVGFGLPDGWYRFTTRVVGNQPQKGGVMLLAPPATIACSDRRRHVRRAVSVPIRCATAGPRSTVRQGRTADISARGICFTSPCRIVEGSAVALWLKPGAARERIELSGAVAWTRRHGRSWLTGVSLLPQASPARHLLAALCKGESQPWTVSGRHR